MMTYDQAHQWAKSELIAGESATVDSRLLLCFVLQCEPVTLMTYPERLLTDSEQSQFRQLIALRKDGHPVAYIMGYRDFWNLRLKVSEKTLIPRPETELLVELALALPLAKNAHAIDLGTGTGAIALALASERPDWHIMGIDFDAAIVELAEQNRVSNSIGNNAHFKQSNWFESIGEQKFDLIVTNPPYVEPDSAYLKQGDLRFEPDTALVAKGNGLGDIKTIIEKSHTKLNIEGWLLIEHGFNQGRDVRELLHNEGFVHVKTESDLNGCERITMAQWCQ